MNPYQTPSTREPDSRRRKRRFNVIAAVTLLCGAVVVSMPGVVLLLSEMSRPVPAGTPYATYDREFFAFGIPVSETTVAWLALALAPCMIIGALMLLFRKTISPKRPSA